MALQDALAAAHLDKALLRELSEEYAACRGLEPLPPAGSEQDMSEAEGGSIASQTQQPSPKRQRRPLKAGGKGGTGAAGGEAAQQESEEEVLELPAELSEQQLRRLVRQLERLLTAGEAEAALQQLEAADTSFLPDHPAAAFALHRCCFLEQLLQPAGAGGGGGTTAALAVVRQHLSPLAQQHPDLQPQLKATLALLLPLSAAAGGDDAASQKQQQKGVADALTVRCEASSLGGRCCAAYESHAGCVLHPHSTPVHLLAGPACCPAPPLPRARAPAAGAAAGATEVRGGAAMIHG